MDEKLYKPFCISVGEIIKEMSDIDVVGMDSLEEERRVNLHGVSSIITLPEPERQIAPGYGARSSLSMASTV